MPNITYKSCYYLFVYYNGNVIRISLNFRALKSKGKIENTIMTQTNLGCDNSWCACDYVFCLKIRITNLKFLTMIRIGNSMISSDIWHKYHQCDISKVLYIISRAVRRVKFSTILKYHEWYLCQTSPTNLLLFVYTTAEMLENIT